MGIDPENLEKTPFDAIINEEPLFILHNQHGMDIAPTNINLSVAEIQLVNMEFREVRLFESIEPIRNNYDFILIDCPPSLGLLSYSSLVAANSPTYPYRNSLQSFSRNEFTVTNYSQS